MDITDLIKTASLEKIQQLHRNGRLANDSTAYIALATALALGKTDIATFLELNRGLDLASKQLLRIPTRDASLDTPLHHAARWGDWNSTLKLLRAQVPMSADTDGNTALHLAFIHERHALVDNFLKLMVAEKSYSNAVNKLGLSYLHIACSRGIKDAIEGLLQVGSAADTVSPNSVLWAGNNALHFAAMSGSVTAVRALTSQEDWRETLDVENAVGLTPSQMIRDQIPDKLVLDGIVSDKGFSHFHRACTQPNPTVIKKFLHSGADVNEIVSSDFCFGDTPLHCAVESRCSDNVAMILQRDPDTSAKNKDNMTPLHLAMYGEQEAIVDTLYKATNVDDQEESDINGLNFFHVACSQNDLETAKKLLANCKKQLNAQVLYDRRVFSRYTALHFAVQNGLVEMVQWLIQSKADVDLGADGVDGSPLHLAFALGHVDIVELLLTNGADPTAVRSVDKKTTLHLLVDWCTDESQFDRSERLLPYIERLVELGMDVDAKDADGNTALHLAAAKAHLGTRCLRALLEQGADVNELNGENHTPFNVFLDADFDVELAQPGDYAILYHHVQKLKVLGLAVDLRNVECYKFIVSEQNWRYNREREDFDADRLKLEMQARTEEKLELQRVDLDKGVGEAASAFTMYDFLKCSDWKAAEFAECEVLSGLAERDEYAKRYPQFGFLIKLRHRLAKRLNDGAVVKDNGKKRRFSCF